MTIKLSEDQRQKIIETMISNGAIIGYLFGSYVRNTAGPLSDLDIAVAFPKSIGDDEQGNRVERIRSILEKEYGRDKVDVINVPKLRNPLLRYIITLGEGEVLFANDISLKNRLADIARAEYEDTKHLRNIQRHALRRLFA